MNKILITLAALAFIGFGLNVAYPQIQGGGDGIAFTQSSVAETCHQMKVGGGVLYSAALSTGASAGFMMIFDLASAPSAGAVVPTVPAQPVAATSGVLQTFNPPVRFGAGLSICFSTTGAFTYTASATADIGAQVQ